jgi:hypothetical protein
VSNYMVGSVDAGMGEGLDWVPADRTSGAGRPVRAGRCGARVWRAVVLEDDRAVPQAGPGRVTPKRGEVRILTRRP